LDSTSGWFGCLPLSSLPVHAHVQPTTLGWPHALSVIGTTRSQAPPTHPHTHTSLPAAKTDHPLPAVTSCTTIRKGTRRGGSSAAPFRPSPTRWASCGPCRGSAFVLSPLYIGSTVRVHAPPSCIFDAWKVVPLPKKLQGTCPCIVMFLRFNPSLACTACAQHHAPVCSRPVRCGAHFLSHAIPRGWLPHQRRVYICVTALHMG
jgi:hypothetical protein